MTFLPLLSLALGIAAAPAGDSVAAAVQKGLLAAAPAGVTRAEVTSHRDRLAVGCVVSEAKPLGQVLGSGEITFKLEGKDGHGACFGWSWTQTKLFSQALVTTRRLATGESLAGAYAPGERELLVGHSFVLQAPADGVAAYALQPDLVLEPKNIRSPGQIPGRAVAVELHYGDLVVETQGQTIPCALNAACALLASGKRVTGSWTNGRLEVSVP